MRTPQRLQIEARCCVFRTGTFLNNVEINIFICCPLNFPAVPLREQLRCQAIDFPSTLEKPYILISYDMMVDLQMTRLGV